MSDNDNNEIVEGEVLEQPAETRSIEIVPVLPPQEDLAIMPVMNLKQAKKRYDEMVAFVKGIMQEGLDYGTIPGTDKPTLYKPGAEKLSTFFGLRKSFVLLDKIETWARDDPFFFYRYKSQLWRGDTLIAEGIGSANSLEDRYRWRWVSYDRMPEELLPEIDDLRKRGGKISEYTFAIEESRTEGEYSKPLDYWMRFRDAIANGTAVNVTKWTKDKKGYPAWEIENTYYRIPNPDIFTLVNTLDKMAQKRGFVQSVLIGCNASEFFSQDYEDMPIESVTGVEDESTPKPDYTKEQGKGERSPEEEPEATPRLEHQWEEPIRDFIIDQGFVQGKTKTAMQNRLVAILDASPFVDVPYGDLDLVEALAWVIGWEEVKEAHGKMKAENRRKIVFDNWKAQAIREKWIDLAISKIPPDPQ